MLTTLIRGFILYFVIMLSIRLMGKRQIGEMQPTELVTTILISEIAAIPLDSNDIPLINSVMTVLFWVTAQNMATSILCLLLSCMVTNMVKCRTLTVLTIWTTVLTKAGVLVTMLTL